MALIIEDGTIVANANSYVTLAEARAYALVRGVSLSATDSVLEILVIKSMDYLESFDMQFKGYRKSTEQALCWPRYDVYRDNIGGGYFGRAVLVEYPAIPIELKNALCQLIIDSNSFDIDPNVLLTDKTQKIKERVDGAIEVEYAQPKEIRTRPSLRKFDNLISPLLKSSVSGLSVFFARA